MGTTFAISILLIIALFNWQETIGLVQRNDAIFKLIGLGIGPILALLGFLWGLLDKAEMKDLTEALGEAKALAGAERESADRARAEVDAKVAHIRRLEHDLRTIADGSRLWKLSSNSPFSTYRGWKHDPRGAKVVTVGLFKGGVGKTHLAANFAAYVSEKQQKPVLLIDLDYQGSLSTQILTAAGLEQKGSKVDALFAAGADLVTLNEQRIHLASQPHGTVLNGGKGLSRAWIVPSDYSLAQVESQLLVDRVFNDVDALDERYRLSHVLLNPDVRREFAVIILDTPPRMTLGTVNALVASHYYVLPVIFDRVSSEAIKPFLAQLALLKSDLDLDVRPAGIVGMMTRQSVLSASELRYRDVVADVANEVLGLANHLVVGHIPRKAQVTNADDLGYFLSDSDGPLRERFYNSVFNELWTRIMGHPESA